MRSRTARVPLIVIIGALMALLALPALTAARPLRLRPLVPGSRYLALGDSVTFGYEEGGVTPKPNYKDAASFLGYPEQIAAELKVRVVNAACPGETSASFINPAAQSNGCENTPHAPKIGYRVLFPLHVRYQGSQLAYAVSYLKAHRDVRLVSLMIGANDGFVCREVTADGCASSAEQQAVFKSISANVRRILSAIRNLAGYRGQIVILHYYSLNYAFPAINAQSQKINAAEDAGARPFHVQTGDGYRQLFLGARKFGGDICAAGLLTRLSSAPVSCGIHPSYSGQALLAQAVLTATRL